MTDDAASRDPGDTARHAMFSRRSALGLIGAVIAGGTGAAGPHPTRPPRLFTDLAGVAIPPDQRDLRTDGHTAPGIGAARYIEDRQADAAFVARHPRASFRSRDGRTFRLAGEAITVEQLGARGDGASNDQPAIQAALDYAADRGIRRVVFGRTRYVLWCPPRRAAWGTGFAEGHPMLVRATVALEAATQATLSFLGPRGGPPDTDVQRIGATPDATSRDFVWRGGAIYLAGDERPGPHLAIDWFRMRGLTLEGNRTHNWNPDGVSRSIPDHVPGDPWDMTDKGLTVVDRYVGDIVIEDCRIQNFRGELLYFGGNGTVRSGRLVNVAAGGTNADAFNPGTQCRWHVERSHFFKAFQAIEGWGGPGGYIQARLSDCYSAGTLWGGIAPTLPGAPFSYPNPGGAPDPSTSIDLVIERCERFQPGSFIRGKVKLVDTTVMVDANLYGAISDIDLDVDYTLDGPSFFGGQALRLSGPANLHTRIGSTQLFVTPPRDCRFRVRMRATDAARRAGRKVGPAFEWGGLIGRGVTCRIEDCGAHAAPPLRSGTVKGDDPQVTIAPCSARPA